MKNDGKEVKKVILVFEDDTREEFNEFAGIVFTPENNATISRIENPKHGLIASERLKKQIKEISIWAMKSLKIEQLFDSPEDFENLMKAMEDNLKKFN